MCPDSDPEKQLSLLVDQLDRPAWQDPDLRLN